MFLYFVKTCKRKDKSHEIEIFPNNLSCVEKKSQISKTKTGPEDGILNLPEVESESKLERPVLSLRQGRGGSRRNRVEMVLVLLYAVEARSQACLTVPPWPSLTRTE